MKHNKHRLENAVVRQNNTNYLYNGENVVEITYYCHHDTNDLPMAYMCKVMYGDDKIVLLKGNNYLDVKT